MSRNLFEVPNDARAAVVVLLDKENKISILPLTAISPLQALTVIFDGWSSLLCAVISMNDEFCEDIEDHLDEDQMNGVLSVLHKYCKMEKEDEE